MVPSQLLVVEVLRRPLEFTLDKNIQVNAFKKSLEYDAEKRLPLEHYLEFIEYKKIVENKVHWPNFKAVFDIPERGQKGISKNLAWMERINELRRIAAHPTEGRNYTVQDFDYIDFVHREFTLRLDGYESSETSITAALP